MFARIVNTKTLKRGMVRVIAVTGRYAVCLCKSTSEGGGESLRNLLGRRGIAEMYSIIKEEQLGD